jgi:hypothetical protein
VETVAEPDHVERDALPARTRFYRRNAGPSRWLMALLSYEQEPARIITAVANRKDPKAMEAMNIRVGPLTFDHGDYDADGDVLYLHVGPPQPGEGEETPEGHVLCFEPGTQQIIGLTVIDARHVVDRDGRLIVTVPETVEASADDLAPALRAA